MFPEDFFRDGVVGCARDVESVLRRLIAPPDKATRDAGGELSAGNTLSSLLQLRTRAAAMHVVDDYRVHPCRADVAVAVFSLAVKLNRSGCKGLACEQAWSIALHQKSHMRALELEATVARGQGALQTRTPLLVDVVPPAVAEVGPCTLGGTHGSAPTTQQDHRWLARAEECVLGALGGGVWNVLRTEGVEAVMSALYAATCFEACADGNGQIMPAMLKICYERICSVIFHAALVVLHERVKSHQHLPLFVVVSIDMLRILSLAYSQQPPQAVGVEDLHLLHEQIASLVHAVLLLCEYVLLCSLVD